MDNKILKDYFDSKDALATLEKEVERLKGELMAYLDAQPANKAILPGVATFSVMSKISWKYSPKVENYIAGLASLKKKEEENGIATQEKVIVYPVMKLIK